MDTPQRIGTAIDFAVPAIVGGGVIQYFSESWTAVAVFEIILLVVLIAIVSPKKSQ
jgi:hypothetical protein